MGKDQDDDVAGSIVVMNRTQHTDDMVPLIKAEIESLNTDGTLPPGVKLVPYYDRSSLVAVTTHTVLHNLIFGCLLVFLIQWIFLGDLRSAIIVALTIPFALFFAIILLVIQGEDANLLSVGAIDFGIIVDFGGHPGGEHLPQLPIAPGGKTALSISWPRVLGDRSDEARPAFRRSRLDRSAAADPHQRAAGRQGGLLFGDDHGCRLRSAVHHGGCGGANLRTDGADLCLCAGGRFDRDLHRDAGPGVVPAARAHPGGGDHSGSVPADALFAGAGMALAHRKITVAWDWHSWWGRCSGDPSRQRFLPALEEGNYWIRAAMPPTLGLEAGTAAAAKMREILLRHPEIITVVSQHGRPDDGSDASPFSNVELFAPLKPFDQWPRVSPRRSSSSSSKEFDSALPGHDLQLLAIYPGQYRGGDLGRERGQLGQDHRPQP